MSEHGLRVSSTIDMSLDRQVWRVQNRIQTWQNTYYDAQLDAVIGRDIGDERLETVSKEQMKGALQAINKLTEFLKELTEEQD